MRRLLAAVIVLCSMSATMFACTRVLDIGDEGGSCGDGGCKPGVMCTQTCASCFCSDKAEWYCSPTCAEDGGTECPATPPTEGVACSTTAPRCTYTNACGQLDTAICVESAWQYYFGKCPPPPNCPKDPPPLGAPCPGNAGLRCPYQNHCGVVFQAVCDGVGWFVERPPPCPDAGCPTTAPEPRSTCTGEAKCAWPNACGTTDFGVCVGGYWTVNRTCTPAGCPTFAPPNGAPCGTEGVDCTWSDGCGGGTRAGTCASGRWSVGGCR